MNHRQPLPALLTISLLSRNEEWEEKLVRTIESRFGLGPTSLSSPFSYSNYYVNELGPAPVRRYLSTKQLISREELPSYKLWSIEIEEQIKDAAGRPVNIDPGCLTLGHLFLASTKDHKQRVYMGKGIFVEPSLYYSSKNWNPFPWSYSDYLSESATEWLNNSRQFLQQLHQIGS